MRIEVLDHGYVELIECWGHGKSGESTGVDGFIAHHDNEVGIIEAARQSTQGSFRGWDPAGCDCEAMVMGGPVHEDGVRVEHLSYCRSLKNPGDHKLLSFLFHNNHSTPFEFAGMIIEVQAPIFVFREWQRHRAASYNEMSARYAPLPDLNYVPSAERILMDGGANKQAGPVKDSKIVGLSTADLFQAALGRAYQSAQIVYEESLKEGIPKELARLVLPVGRYSKMRTSANLRNWLHFLGLRCDPRAQWEIRQYANAVGKIIKEKFPHTYSQIPPTLRSLIEHGSP